MSRFVTKKVDSEQKRSYRQENIRSAIRLLLVALMFVVIFINYDRLRGIDIRNLIAQADSPTKAIVVVLLVYILKSATMVIPASVVNIAVGLSFPTWLALILNFIGSVMELVIAYGIGVFAAELRGEFPDALRQIGRIELMFQPSTNAFYTKRDDRPARKHSAVPRLINRAIRAKSAAMKIARILYSDTRNAFAPSAMAEAISCIRSLPGRALETYRAL